MNILKKLKLTLLATSIMFFPKGGHTMMKPEDEMPPAGSSKQFQPGSEYESVSLAPGSSSGFNSLLPASSSNPFPASPASSSLEGPVEMKKLFGRYFKPSNEIKERLGSLRATKCQEEVKVVTDAIRTNLLEKFATGLWTPPVEDVISFALTLSPQEIVDRSNALTHMIVDLMVDVPRTGHECPGGLLPSFLRTEPVEPVETEDQKYDRKLGYEIQTNPASIISLVSPLLKLHSNQIKNRATAIRENKGFLLPTRRLNDRETIPSILLSLMNLKTEDIARRGASMRKLLDSRTEWATELDPLKLAARHLNNDELESRVNNFLLVRENLSPNFYSYSMKHNSTSLKGKLFSSVLKLAPADFNSYFNDFPKRIMAIKEYEKFLVMERDTSRILSLTDLTSEEIIRRGKAMEQLLPFLHGEQVEKARSLVNTLDVDELESRVNSYFLLSKEYSDLLDQVHLWKSILPILSLEGTAAEGLEGLARLRSFPKGRESSPTSSSSS